MRAFIDRMWTQLREYWGNMSRGSKIRLGILSLLVITLAIVAVTLFSQTTYATLHTAQDQAEVGNIQAALREMGVSFRRDGLRILVPEDKVLEVKADLAAQGVLGQGTPDRSIGQGASGFAVTDAHAKWLYAAQDSEDIRKAILTSPRISSATVTVKPGETSPFRIQSGVKAATAAIMVTVSGGGKLSSTEAQAIAEHVRGVVPGIEYENISITDSNLNHYKVGELTMDFGTEMDTCMALKNMLQGQTQMQVEQLISPIFGVDNIEVAVTVILNWDKVIRESVKFDPPVAGELDGIARSTSDLWEASRKDDEAAGIPGTDSNAMGTVEYPYGTLEAGELYEKMLSEKNYEINEMREVIEKAEGTIEYINVAVTINERAVEEDYTEQVRNLISRLLGINPVNVAVERMPFDYPDTSLADAQQTLAEQEAQNRRQELTKTIIMWSVILLLGIMLMLMIITIARAVKPPEPEPAPVLIGAGIDYIAGDGDDFEDIDEPEYEEVELQKKSTGLEQIERFIDKDPAAVAALLRNWLTDE